MDSDTKMPHLPRGGAGKPRVLEKDGRVTFKSQTAYSGVAISAPE